MEALPAHRFSNRGGGVCSAFSSLLLERFLSGKSVVLDIVMKTPIEASILPLERFSVPIICVEPVCERPANDEAER
jgi:hypothetical protein